MQLILDFETNTTIEEHLSELAEFLEKRRIERAISYTQLQKVAKELGHGINLAVKIKNANMVTKTLNTLTLPMLLDFKFKIESQTGEITIKSGVLWVNSFMTFLICCHQESGVSREAFAKWLGVSNFSAAKWPKTTNITLKYLFKCLKALKYKMIFETN